MMSQVALNPVPPMALELPVPVLATDVPAAIPATNASPSENSSSSDSSSSDDDSPMTSWPVKVSIPCPTCRTLTSTTFNFAATSTARRQGALLERVHPSQRPRLDYQSTQTTNLFEGVVFRCSVIPVTTMSRRSPIAWDNNNPTANLPVPTTWKTGGAMKGPADLVVATLAITWLVAHRK